MSTISIAMATYDGARFIREQLDSLATQTHLPTELVVTDDGSTDGTLAIIADFARTAPFPVRVHRNEQRLGYKGNFMCCASLCVGELIAFCDQDDIWLPRKLAIQAASLDDPNVLLSSHDAILIGSDGTRLDRVFRHNDLSPSMTFWNAAPFAFSMGFTLMFRRNLLRFSGIWPQSIDNNAVGERMAHDQWFFFVALIFGYVSHNGECLALYRQHDRNTSGLRSEHSRLSRLIQLLADRLPEYERLTSATLNRKDLLDAFASVDQDVLAIFGPDAPIRVQRAVQAFHALHAATKRRRDLYGSRSMIHRLIIYMECIKSGDYRRDSQWHFTLNGAIRDLLSLPINLRPLQR